MVVEEREISRFHYRCIYMVSLHVIIDTSPQSLHVPSPLPMGARCVFKREPVHLSIVRKPLQSLDVPLHLSVIATL